MLDTCTSIYKPRSNKKSTTEQFIQKAIFVHGEKKYDYSKVDYKHSKTKAIIICPIHGEFEQTPNSHLSGQGCPKCKDDGDRSSIEQFIRKAIFVHGEKKYDYSKVDYKQCMSKVIIICPEHGEFEQIPNNHLSGNGCPKCKADEYRSSTEQFVQRSILVHGDKYDYSKVDYKQSKIKVIIICPIHGEFEQRPASHLSGNGCPKCKSENQRRLNAIRFEDTYDVATLYFLRCYNDSEVFLKIGITSKTVDKRYTHKKSMPYNRETLYEWTGDSKYVMELEDKVKSLFLYHKPEIMFGGGHSETLHISQEKMILEFIRLNLVS